MLLAVGTVANTKTYRLATHIWKEPRHDQENYSTLPARDRPSDHFAQDQDALKQSGEGTQHPDQPANPVLGRVGTAPYRTTWWQGQIAINSLILMTQPCGIGQPARLRAAKLRTKAVTIVAEPTTEHERIVAAWLRSRGYDPEFNPAVVTKGRNPDFFARGATQPKAIWAEVKTIEPEDVTLAMGRAWEVMRSATLPTGLHGHGTLYVNDLTRDQSVRSVLNLFANNVESYRGERVRLVFIQQVADKKGVKRLSFTDQALPERFWIRGAGEHKYGVCPGVLDDGLRMATLPDGLEVPAFHLFDWHEKADCTLVATLDPDRLPFNIHPMGGGFVSMGDRARNALETANRQIRNACKFQQAPGIAVIVPSPIAFVDDSHIGAAAYGRLAFSITVPEGKASQLFHGPDAAFQPSKNRHLSVAVRLNRDGQGGMFFPNPYAHYPIDKGAAVLNGLVCYPPAAALSPVP